MRLRAPLYYQGQNVGGGEEEIEFLLPGRERLHPRYESNNAEPFQLLAPKKQPRGSTTKKKEGLRDPEEGNGSQCSHWRKGTKTM